MAIDPTKENALLLCHGAESKDTYRWGDVEHYVLFAIHVFSLEKLESGIWEHKKSHDIDKLYVVVYHILVSLLCFA